ncbi:MAG: hypothetical protein ABR599_05840 [Gemmatimonadota bacterium]
MHRSPRLQALAFVLAALTLGCEGGQGSAADVDDAKPAGAGEVAATNTDTAPGATATSPLGALAEAQRLQIRTSLSALNKALLNFHVLNDRYPGDLGELESDPSTAAALIELRDLTRDLSYRAEDGGYRLQATLPNGRPLTMTGSDPTLRPDAP